MHSGNGVHEELNRAAIACFDSALSDVGLIDAPLRGCLHDYFAWATTTTMDAYHDSADDVPAALPLPTWSGLLPAATADWPEAGGGASAQDEGRQRSEATPA